jgi:undecaprenyl-diphosphatase UppP
MDLISVIILAIVQGITEFLPISSDGHLVVVQALLEWLTGRGDLPGGLGLEITLHAGTLLAILAVFHRSLWRLVGHDRRVLGLLIVGTLPAVALGLPAWMWCKDLLENTLLAGLMLPVTGGILLWAARRPLGDVSYQEISYRDALLIGICQATALLPGISRSGTTIAAGLALGLRREAAATFSFLLAVPAIGGACLLLLVKSLLSDEPGSIASPVLGAGVGISFVVGILALAWLLRWLNEGKLRWFAWWCIPVGLTVVVWQLAAVEPILSAADKTGTGSEQSWQEIGNGLAAKVPVPLLLGPKSAQAGEPPASTTKEQDTAMSADYEKLPLPAAAAEAGLKAATALAFTEGPACDAAGNVYFSDILNDRLWKLAPDGTRTIFREPAGRTNGNSFDREGRLLHCEGAEMGTGGGRRVARTDLGSGQYEVLTDRYERALYNSPNDICVDGRGRIYFTDPRYGDRSDMEMEVEGVYRIDLDGTVARILEQPAIQRPNGLAVTMDSKRLYLVDSNHFVGGNRKIWSFDLDEDGNPSNQRLVYDFAPGRGGDGMRLDVEGNLYVAAGVMTPRGPHETRDVPPGIYIMTPAGKLTGRIPIAEDLLTNLAFGGPDGRTLFITAGKTLFTTRVAVPGQVAYPKWTE